MEEYVMDHLKIYRKRMIPDECILLKDDIILERTDDIIITRRDFHHGYSCYFLKLGYKVSKFYREDNSLLYWYCDIVDYTYRETGEELLVTDLLADVVIYPDGYIKVLDLNELAVAIEQTLCEPHVITQALRKLDNLLNLIYDDKFDTLTSYIEKWVEK